MVLLDPCRGAMAALDHGLTHFFFCEWPDNKLDFASHKDIQPLDVKRRLIGS